MPLSETMEFEDAYEPELTMDLDEKTRFLAHPGTIALWMFVDGALAAETYGAPGDDAPRTAGRAIACNSTTILPAFRQRGFAKILKAYWLGMVRAAGYTSVTGYATTPAMLAVNAAFGAVVTARIDRYAGTSRTAHHYVLTL